MSALRDGASQKRDYPSWYTGSDQCVQVYGCCVEGVCSVRAGVAAARAIKDVLRH